jgi:hypothetical protein
MSTPSPDNDREFLTFHPDVEPMPVGVIDTILLSLLTCVLGGVARLSPLSRAQALARSTPCLGGAPVHCGLR